MTDKLYALIKYEDAYVQPLIFSALEKGIYSDSYRLIDSLDELPTQNARLLQISSYETISFDHLVEHAESSLANAYIIRKGLIRKHYLAATGRQWISKHPESVLKDHLLPTLELELDFAEFLDEALLEAYELHDAFRRNEGKSPEERDWWILKPGMSDGGRDIRLFSTEDELREIFEEWETTTSVDSQDDENAAGEAHTSPDSVRGTACPSDGTMVSQLRHFIVQPYIHAPLLFPSSPRKFHIRAYVLAVASLRVYVYRPMLALFATAPYMHPGSTSRNDQIHLTNTCLDDTPTEGRVQCFWDLPAAPALGTTWKEDVFDQIGAVTAEIFEAAARGMMVHFQTLPNVFEIFGVDFLVDESGTAWLLEVNAFPDFKQTGDELKGLVAGLFEDTVTVAVAGFFPGCGRSDEAVGRRLRKVLDLDLGRR
ncbi:MAG: hypothetical protein M1826_004795 [Phylliscum demangeonii]|nr:MAG: hypothetical protein M1826_004795 [Phylliscum demangeonii]